MNTYAGGRANKGIIKNYNGMNTELGYDGDRRTGCKGETVVNGSVVERARRKAPVIPRRMPCWMRNVGFVLRCFTCKGVRLLKRS